MGLGDHLMLNGEAFVILDGDTVDEGVEKDTGSISFRDARIFFEDDEGSDIFVEREEVMQQERKRLEGEI